MPLAQAAISGARKKISRNGFFFFFFFELSCFLLLSLFYEVILFIYIFLGVLYSTRDLSFPAWMEPTPHSVEGGVLTTGPLAKSLYLMSLLYPVRNSD